MNARKDTMRIFATTPIHVGSAELARRQSRYDELCPDWIRITLRDLDPDAPGSLETAADIRESEERVVEVLRAVPSGYDAVLADCILDPGGPEFAAESEVRVLGLLRMSFGWEVCTGRRPGAVARNQAIADELADRVASYGWADSFSGVEVLGLGVEAIAVGNQWDEAAAGAVDRLGKTGAVTVINGCSAVELPPREVAGGARLVDPTALALRLLATGEAR
ncbi:hypothetical protein [Kribbella sancticallisti]